VLQGQGMTIADAARQFGITERRCHINFSRSKYRNFSKRMLLNFNDLQDLNFYQKGEICQLMSLRDNAIADPTPNRLLQ